MGTNREQSSELSVGGRLDEIFQPNDVRIEAVIISNGVREVDVFRLLVNINIYEDLYSNVLTGDLTLMDAINLIGSFPFVGLERVEIVFKTPGFPDREKTELFFDVYQISERNTGVTGDGTDTMQTYTLHFVSPAMLRNRQSRVRKSFANMPIGEMVERITGDMLKEDVDVEPTTGIHSFLIPSWTPFQAINWLGARARPESNPHAANYLFFETVKGFQFRSVNSITQEQPTIRFVYDPGNVRLTQDEKSLTGERFILPELQLIRNYSILQSGSTLERIDQGMFASKLITHDIVTKTFTVDEFSYKDDFRRQQHLEDNLYDDQLLKNPQDAKAFAGSQRHGESFDSVVKFYPKHSFLHDGIPNSDESEKWVLQRMSHMRQLEAQRLKIETPGLNFVSVGQVIILEVPRPENTAGRPHPDDRDPEISGNYIVTTIHHIIGVDDYKMILEVSKESLPTRSKQDEADILDATSTSIRYGTSGGTDILTGRA